MTLEMSMRLTYLYPLPFLIVGLIVLVYRSKLSKNEDGIHGPFKPIFPGANKKGINTKNKGIVFGTLFTVAGAALPLLIYINQSSKFNFYKKVYKEKRFSVVQGRVEKYHPMPKGGHDTERFDVSGVHFEYMDFDKSNYGYNNAASNGGAIKSNLVVRISYFNNGERNVILKLETE